ncbi:MAG: hypothetical protein M3N53_01530 [Actinomycetota bacterium]|nr:hypothetical protein [Actinomycetota bacterium]
MRGTSPDKGRVSSSVDRTRLQRTLALLASLGLWLVAAGPPDDEPIARWAGMLVFHLLAALLIRWLLVRTQKPRPRLWSPWLFVIAAGVALLRRLGP